jgi:hypothetical protein
VFSRFIELPEPSGTIETSNTEMRLLNFNKSQAVRGMTVPQPGSRGTASLIGPEQGSIKLEMRNGNQGTACGDFFDDSAFLLILLIAKTTVLE